MKDENGRYMGLAVVMYILTPVLIIYGTLALISHSGNQIIDWLMTTSPATATVVDAPVEATLTDTKRPLGLMGMPAASSGSDLPVIMSVPSKDVLPAADEEQRRSRQWGRDAYSKDFEWTFPLDADGSFSVKNISGKIIVSSWDRSEVRIMARKIAQARDESEAEAAFEEVRIEIDESDDEIEIETDYPDHRWDNEIHVSVDYEITVPRQADVRARSVSGDVDVINIQGEVLAKSVSGHVQAEEIGDDLQAESVSGHVMVRDVSGETELTSVSGNIEAQNVRGDVEAHTTSGRIDLRNVTAKEVSARSTSGTLTFEGAIMADGEYEMESHSGGVRIMVPSDASFDLRAKTFSGSIDSDLPVTLRRSSSSRHGRQKSLVGLVNDGGADVALSSFSGSIRIRSESN